MRYLLILLLCLTSCASEELPSKTISVLFNNVALYKGDIYVTQEYLLEVELLIDDQATVSYYIDGFEVLRSVYPPYKLRYRNSEQGTHTLSIWIDEECVSKYIFKVVPSSDDLPDKRELGSYTSRFRI